MGARLLGDKATDGPSTPFVRFGRGRPGSTGRGVSARVGDQVTLPRTDYRSKWRHRSIPSQSSPSANPRPTMASSGNRYIHQ